MKPIVLLSLDVSSSCTGWALVRGPAAARPARFGLIRSSAESIERIDAMTAGVVELLDQLRPDYVVLEWSSGKVHRRLGRIHGLAVLGQAQGAVRERVRMVWGEPDLVNESEWTGGRNKENRAKYLIATCPEYSQAAADDPGRDAADAVGLGLWWMTREFQRLLTAR